LIKAVLRSPTDLKVSKTKTWKVLKQRHQTKNEMDSIVERIWSDSRSFNELLDDPFWRQKMASKPDNYRQLIELRDSKMAPDDNWVLLLTKPFDKLVKPIQYDRLRISQEGMCIEDGTQNEMLSSNTIKVARNEVVSLQLGKNTFVHQKVILEQEDYQDILESHDRLQSDNFKPFDVIYDKALCWCREAAERLEPLWRWMESYIFVPKANSWNNTKTGGLWIYGPPSAGKSSLVVNFIGMVFNYWSVSLNKHTVNNKNSNSDRITARSTQFLFIDDFNLYQYARELPNMSDILHFLSGYHQNLRVMYGSINNQFQTPVILCSNHKRDDLPENLPPEWTAAIQSRITHTMDVPLQYFESLNSTMQDTQLTMHQLYRLLWNFYYRERLYDILKTTAWLPPDQQRLQHIQFHPDFKL
jgi:hypothetical protein